MLGVAILGSVLILCEPSVQNQFSMGDKLKFSRSFKRELKYFELFFLVQQFLSMKTELTTLFVFELYSAGEPSLIPTALTYRYFLVQ